MNSCRWKTVEMPQIENNFRSSYNRSFEYKNVVDHPLTQIRIKRDTRKDLRTPIMQEKSLSTYNSSFEFNNQNFIKKADFYPRSSVNFKPNLRRLHEEYMRNPTKPDEFGSTTTGTTHKALMPISIPQTLLNYHPARENTCFIQIRGKGEFPFIPPNEISFHKLLDTCVSTSHLNHTDFSENQRNGIAKRDIITYYDAVGVLKCRGTRISSHFGPYFDKEPKSLYRQFPKHVWRVPHSGITSTYNKDYKHGTMNFDPFEYDREFPVVHELTHCC